MGADDQQVAPGAILPKEGPLAPACSMLPMVAEADLFALLWADVVASDMLEIPVIPGHLPN